MISTRLWTASREQWEFWIPYIKALQCISFLSESFWRIIRNQHGDEYIYFNCLNIKKLEPSRRAKKQLKHSLLAYRCFFEFCFTRIQNPFLQAWGLQSRILWLWYFYSSQSPKHFQRIAFLLDLRFFPLLCCLHGPVAISLNSSSHLSTSNEQEKANPGISLFCTRWINN